MADAGVKAACDPVDGLDLEPVIRKLTAKVEHGGYDWPVQSARDVAGEYRDFLKMVRDSFNASTAQSRVSEISPPGKMVDIFWHTHILFTRKYFQDCDTVFGHYLHHEPILPDE